MSNLSTSINTAIKELELVDECNIGDESKDYEPVVNLIKEGFRVLNCTESDLLDIVLCQVREDTVAQWSEDSRVRPDTKDYQEIVRLFYDVRKLKNNPEKLIDHLDKWFNETIDKTL